MSYASEVTADTPVAWYRCDEASGNIQDSSGNGNHATTTVGAGSATYQETGALTSEPSSKSIKVTDFAFSIPDHATLDTGDTHTLECWVRFNSIPASGYTTLMTKQSGMYELRCDTSGNILIIREGVTIIATSTVSLSADGNFHHIVWTKSGATNVLYIDKVDRTGSVTNDTLVNNDQTLRVMGYFDSTNDLDGWMDEIAIYSTALTSGRVTAHYDAAFATTPKLRVVTSSLRW